MVRSPVIPRPQWLVLIVLVTVCVLVAGVCAFEALWVGQPFENSPAHPWGSLVLWMGAGFALATPVACLPVMAFPVRRRVALLSGGIIALVVGLAGFFVTRAL